MIWAGISEVNNMNRVQIYYFANGASLDNRPHGCSPLHEQISEAIKPTFGPQKRMELPAIHYQLTFSQSTRQ